MMPEEPTHRPPTFAPAAERNQDPILEVLKTILPKAGLLLEIASGTGQHAAYMAPRLGPGLIWQPGDRDRSALADIDNHARQSGCPTIRPAVFLDVTASDWAISEADAIYCCNMIHIAPWAASEGLFAGASRLLPADGPLVLYGPFRRNGEHTAPSNTAFDTHLKTQDDRWGVRCLDTEVTPLSEHHGFRLDAVISMPANNLIVVFRRRPPV